MGMYSFDHRLSYNIHTNCLIGDGSKVLDGEESGERSDSSG